MPSFAGFSCAFPEFDTFVAQRRVVEGAGFDVTTLVRVMFCIAFIEISSADPWMAELT